MEMLISTATLLVAAVVSGIICGLLPRVPGNYVSILVGIIIALITPLNGLVTQFHSEIFMYVIAPLIYFEGQMTRIYFVRSWWRQIIGTAVILVVVSTVAAGGAVYLLGLPLALSFVIAAISTPTDATALETVSEGRIVPEQQGKMLRAEALFNDATGIVLLEAMAVWVRGGHFRYQAALGNFFLTAVGGIIVGALFGLVMINFRQVMRKFTRSTYNAQEMLFLITPFFVYLVAEELKVSGIIAVVCAGLVQNSESSLSRFRHPRQYHNSYVVVDLVRDLLNNMVFIILGILIVRIIRADLIAADVNFIWIAAGITIYLVMLLVRYLYGRLIKMTPKGSVIFALGGVHGAITLALVFSVASSLDTRQFQLVVLTETLLVLLSMLVPSLVFRLILPADIADTTVEERTNKLRHEMVIEGIKAVTAMYLPENVKKSVLYDLRDQKGATTFNDFWRQWSVRSSHEEFSATERDLERQALLWAFRAERNYLTMVAQREELRQYVFELYNEVVLAESILMDPQINDI